ncbi:sulfatase-like hydrolase/transferase [Archangium sp.]|uniref:sulfatase-like hydrolase/transferase n=1 Tax=Archangium sp. TaxID=1872627 RepID=UPI0039C86B0F
MGALKIYAAMMKNMYAGIGRVLKALERANLERNTLVIFTSDNGGERYLYHCGRTTRSRRRSRWTGAPRSWRHRAPTHIRNIRSTVRISFWFARAPGPSTSERCSGVRALARRRETASGNI